MLTRPLRKWLNVLGLSVAIVTAVAMPGGYLIERYFDAGNDLNFKGQLNASRIAQYVYTHNTMWQYQQLRLSDLIQLPHTGTPPVNQKVYDENHQLVLDDKVPLRGPVVARSTPILVRGAKVGTLVVEAGLGEILSTAALIGLLGIALGAVIYFSLRLLPLRALDRTLDALHGTERVLEQQNRQLDAALENMTQGLCMYDSEERLAVCNKRFLEMFGLTSADLPLGSTLYDVFHKRAETGTLTAAEVEPLAAEILASVRAGKILHRVLQLPDGRTIALVNKPIGDGGWVATLEDITERLKTEEKIRQLAHFDALTELPNRATFHKRVEEVLARLHGAQIVAVLSIDLDHFKAVNDTHGHPVGDRLLQKVAERMQRCVSAEDLVARLGADEFAVVQVAIGRPGHITALATQLIAAIGAPYDIDGVQIVLGASIGVAVAPSDSDVVDILLKQADLALTRAKTDGGGVYRFFKPDMDARIQARQTLELDLRKAITNGEFRLLYQPIMNVESRRIIGCEALVRWHHPERGMISPLEFIPLAEETGLIVPLGEWVLRLACAEASQWPKHMSVAVNLSPVQFKNGGLVKAVIGALSSAGLAASRLELEITELALLQDNESVIATLQQLRARGIRIAMDDFGTGYSSLSYLRRFPFDKIKIDQSFVRDLTEKDDSVAIIRAVVSLSSSLGITTTAEGVETQEQFDRLAAEGCDQAQGFLFSPPRPGREIERLIRELAPAVPAVA